MGCDIHDYVEVWNGGRWEKVGEVFKNPYHRPGEENKYYPPDEDDPDDEGWYDNQELIDSPIYVRNYNLFGILANVRNGSGFAGVDTGDGYVPISDPKGLPEDVSPEIRKKSERWGCDGHSHSYLTVQEILDYDWDRTTKQRGVVSPEQYLAFKQLGHPTDYSGGVWGGSVVEITPEEMDFMLSVGKIEDLKGLEVPQYYTQVEWEEPYAEACPWFLEEIIPQLLELGDPEDVRLVFWFDN